jgi:hypothetical protein
MYAASNFRQCVSIFSTPFTVLVPVTFTITARSDARLMWQVWGGDTQSLFTTTATDGKPATVSFSTSVRASTVLSTGTLWAEPVSIYWKSSDLSLFPTAYATSLASAIGVPFSADVPPNAFPIPPPSPVGLNAGAKAGIVVAAFLGVALLIGALILLFLRRRRQRIRHPDVPEMTGQDSGFKTMLAGKWRAEVDGDSNPVEIDSRNALVIPGSPVELEDSQGGRSGSLRRP